MGFSSQAGSVGFRTQATKGSYLSPASGGIFMRTKSGSLGGTRDLLIPDAEIGGNRDIPDAYLGPIRFEGEYEFYARLDSITTLAYGALGVKSSSSTGSAGTLVGTHVITATPGTALPWISIEENIGDDFEHFRYTDARVGSFHLEAEANGYLMGKAQFVALTQVAVPSASATASPTFDSGPMIVGSNVVVEWDGEQLPAKSFSLDINNNPETDDFRLGSLFLGDMTPKRREITLSVSIRPEDSALWRTAMYGSAVATQAGGTSVKESVSIVCETYEFIGSTAVPYSLSIDIPKAALKPFAVSPSGDDVLTHDIEIQVLRPDPTVEVLTMTVVNHKASVA